jgi:hypothetical protein
MDLSATLDIIIKELCDDTDVLKTFLNFVGVESDKSSFLKVPPL